jgi:PAS domain S-box-containing protein
VSPETPPEFSLLLAATPEALIVTTVDGQIVAANAPAAALFGRPAEALQTYHVGALLPEELPEGERARRFAQRPSGAAFPAEVTRTRFSVAGETWFSVLVLDASRQEAIESRLSERDRQLERAARLAQLATWRWDHAALRFELSPEFCALIGIGADQSRLGLVEAMKWVHPDDRQPVIERMQQDFASGSSFAFDMRLRRADGHAIPVHCDGEIDFDARGAPVGVFGVVQRVTGHELVQLVRRYFDLEAEVAERALAAQALRAERDRAQQYLDVAGVMFIGLDARGHVQLANGRAAEILGCPVDEIIGSDWFGRFVPEAMRDSVRTVFGRLMTGDGHVDGIARYENPVLRADGKERLIAWHNVVLRDDTGRLTGTLSSGEDITDRRRAELTLQRTMHEVQAVNRELESFAYTVSHDLRTPLRTIQGFSQLLLADHRQSLDVEAQALLGRIAHNAERLNELTEHLLALSRVGRATLTLRPLDLATVAREVVDMLAGAPGADRIEWVIPASLPARADQDLMRALLQNLCDNAVKFTRTVPHPRVEFGQADDGVYFVRDNGVGFDMAFADKLFRPFQRLHDRSIEGNGVGLATVARVVERHGGRVWAESSPGHGACFRFTIGTGGG